MDMASIVNQDGKNKGNHMMGQCVLLDLAMGDEVRVRRKKIPVKVGDYPRYMSTPSQVPGLQIGLTFISHSLLVKKREKVIFFKLIFQVFC